MEEKIFMENKHMKRSSISLPIREVQIKTSEVSLLQYCDLQEKYTFDLLSEFLAHNLQSS